MKILTAASVMILGLGGCASTALAPPPVETASVAPCQQRQSSGPEEATQNFGTCLAAADGMAARAKPTAANPDGTHWDMPVMQGFVAGTTHGATGTDGG